MLTQFHLENFKGHRDTELALARFTVLVGDNGSGKTSVLEALRFNQQLIDCTMHPDVPKPSFDELLRRGSYRMRLSLDGVNHGHLWAAAVELTPPDPDHWMLHVSGVDLAGPFNTKDDVTRRNSRELVRIGQLTGEVALYRFRADQIAASAYSDRPGSFVEEDGALTAVALASLKLADDDAFNRIETALRALVPSLQRVLIRPATLLHPSNPNPVIGSKLHFDFRGATNIPAHHASQGTLVVLALLTVLHGPNRPRVILLDDFDHALHPRAQVELVRTINRLLTLPDFQDTQIIATTHSPYVLDEISPENIIAFALRDDGTVAAKPLSEHPDAPKLNGSLKSGELWSLDAERDWVR